jgi:NitT/TauT family transport system substrate-binding protein
MAALTLAALMLTGCGALGGETSAPQGSGQLTKIKVAVLPTMDVVPLYLAMDAGYFKQEGLEVDPVTAASGADCVAKLASGEVQVAFSSWTPFVVARSKNVADIKLVADATTAAPNYAVVAVAANSPIAGIRDLPGKRVAITARGTISHLLVQAQLKANGLDPNGVQYIEMGFPQMAPALAAGQIDAAFLVEPFLTSAMKTTNARPLFDTLTGPTADLPLTGYGAKADYVTGNKATVEAFQRALKKATTDAQNDRSKVDPILQKVGKVDADIAHRAALTEFTSSLDPTRLQRVVDLMVEFKALDKSFPVSEMIAGPPR